MEHLAVSGSAAIVLTSDLYRRNKGTLCDERTLPNISGHKSQNEPNSRRRRGPRRDVRLRLRVSNANGGDTHRLKEELSAAKNRLQHQAFNINGSIGDLQTEALRAVANEKEEIARVALQRRQASLFIVEALHQKIIDLDHEKQNLTSAALQVMEKMESFQTSKDRLQTQPTASAEEITQIRSLVDDMLQEKEHLSLAASQAKHVLDNIDQPKIPEDFSGKDAVRIIRELAPLSVAQNIEEQLAYLKTLNPDP